MRATRLSTWMALTAVLLVAACGVPGEDRPRSVDPPLTPLTASTPPTPTTDPYGSLAEVVCLVRDDSLVPVVRRVAVLPSVEDHLGQLVAGPTAAERAAGLTSALTGSRVAGVALADGEARVELKGDEGVARSDDVLAFGQVVCTLTTRPDVTRVVFHRGEGAVAVPRGDGSLSDAPLTASDYAAITGPS
jgi:hypothetical protein